MKEKAYQVTEDRLYREIIHKLNTTIALNRHLPDISRCGEKFEALEQAAHSRDAQINHLLSITNCLLKYLPNSPALEQVFTNFLKDYIHLVNPDMPPYEGALYLNRENGPPGHPYLQQT